MIINNTALFVPSWYSILLFRTFSDHHILHHRTLPLFPLYPALFFFIVLIITYIIYFLPIVLSALHSCLCSDKILFTKQAMGYIWAVVSLFNHGLGSWTQLSSRPSCLSFSFSLLHLLWLPRLFQAPLLIFFCLQGPPRKPSVNLVYIAIMCNV